MLKFIDNQGDYFASNYFDEDFTRKVFEKTGYSDEDVKGFNKNISSLKDKYFKYKNEYLSLKRTKDRIKTTYAFHTELLNALGYNGNRNEYDELYLLKENEGIPVRNKLYRGNKPHLFIMEMQSLISEIDKPAQDLFEQVYRREQWESVFQINNPDVHLSPSVINEAISELFLIEQDIRPYYVLLLAGSEVYLMQYEKWFRGSYLRFSIEDLFDEAIIKRDYYSLFYFLTSKGTLAPDADLVLMEQLDEDSHKSAYAVTKDLKEGIIKAVEMLANEAVYFLNTNEKDYELNELFAQNIKDDCITLIYRLLFILYAESRSELELLPLNDRTYERGYSLEMLRDLEQVPLTSESSKNGYFFHDSLFTLFKLINKGLNEKSANTKSFIINHIDTPLFDDDRYKVIKDIKFRNFIWQDIICQLSLSQKQRGKTRGRISYANLGINQLGSVYEGLLSYKGFFADQDYIEVKKSDDATGKDGTYVVPRSRRADFEESEIVKDPDDQEKDKIITKGTFVYRLSGRDRQKSASYYTPEVLTKTVVKYTLKPILERLENKEIKADSLLELKILEPAMGAAAFQNEVIDQLASAYLDWKQKEVNKKVSPGKYREELQKVKAYIATNNVYGVDNNPTAIELGKLSLWLNVIHKDMETPYFGYRLGIGNAVVGAWRKVYHKDDIIFEIDKESNRVKKKEWWEKAPRQITFGGKGKRKSEEIYHFLLPDKNIVPSAGIDMLREEFPNEARHVQKWRTEFCKPISDSEFTALKFISNKIDELFEQHYINQKQIIEYTKDKSAIWPQKTQQLELISYYDKENFSSQRDNVNAPYYKLKTIMDYWCSLWFWDMRETLELPTRQEYIDDIINILELDLEKVISNERIKTEEEIDVFAFKGEQLDLGISEPEQPRLKGYKSELQKRVVSDLITKYTPQTNLFPDKRKNLLQKYSNQYHFFHYELEFIEVFKERGGFDIIVGNPPWIKLEFYEKGVLAEKNPEVLIRKTSSPQVKAILNDFLNDIVLKETYISEFIDSESYAIFLNSIQNYPLLVGQQTDVYKCILENTFKLIGSTGYIGLLHPDSIYDDAKGTILRKEVYKRLKYHFQFINELKLFTEVHHEKQFGIHIYSGFKNEIDFVSIHNLFHPNTINNSFIHNGNGTVSGVKYKLDSENNYTWNLHPHKARIIHYDKKRLKLLAKTFEDSEDWESAKLISIHVDTILDVIEKISTINYRVSNLNFIPTRCFDETNAVKKGIIRDINHSTQYPIYNNYELIINGPHIHVSNPLYKCPKTVYTKNADYNTIDLEQIEEDFLPRTKYLPNDTKEELLNRFETLSYDKNWIDTYKVGMRAMVGPGSERTLQSAILAPKILHTHGVLSLSFQELINVTIVQSLCSSLVVDFFIKSKGVINIQPNTINSIPLINKQSYLDKIIIRTLLLNCLTIYYKNIWENLYKSVWLKETWSIEDKRLKPFKTIDKLWNWNIPLRNHFERRQALVEIDVLVAMAFNISLQELQTIYNIQFSTLHQNEDETFYDKNGKIVSTISSGLSDIGLKKEEFDRIKHEKNGKFEKIINNDLYKNKKIIYEAPFTKCNRIEDYKTAWAHFEKIFSKENN